MTSTATITHDAAGITENAAVRTGSVVEQLIAPAGERVEQIPLGLIEPHPRNRKVTKGDVDDLVASVKTEGVLLPLIVTPGDAYNADRPDGLPEVDPRHYVITGGGHRRRMAAELAGLATVPCLVRVSFAGSRGRLAALLENLHRLDLDPFEEAAAFAELVNEHHLKQRDLATTVGRNQSHISKRLTLLKLPSTIREAVRVGTLSLADALELARAADMPDVLDEAYQLITRHRLSGDRAVRTATTAREGRIRREAATRDLEIAGVKVVDRAPSHGLYSRTDPVRLAATKLNQAKHERETCHAAYIGTDGEVTYACTHPGRHLPEGASSLKLTKAPREDLLRWARGGSTVDADVRRQRTALKKQIPARIQVARQIVRAGLTDRDADAELVRRGLVGATFHSYFGRADTWKVVKDLVELVDGDYPTEEHTDRLLSKVPHDWVLRALAIAHHEGQLRANHLTWGADQRYYLDTLATAGYEVSDVEHEKLGDKRSMAGEWVPPSPDELAATAAAEDGAPCRVCGKRTPDLESGVTWVDEDLCSACSDATDAGWLAPDNDDAIPANYPVACAECEHSQPDKACSCTTCFCNEATG